MENDKAHSVAWNPDRNFAFIKPTMGKRGNFCLLIKKNKKQGEE